MRDGLAQASAQMETELHDHAELKACSKRELQDLRRSLEAELSAAKKEHEAELSSVKRALEAELSETKRGHEAELSEGRKAHDAQLSEVKKTADTDLQAAKASAHQEVRPAMQNSGCLMPFCLSSPLWACIGLWCLVVASDVGMWPPRSQAMSQPYIQRLASD